jgi:galactose mutarotase-like enzyme
MNHIIENDSIRFVSESYNVSPCFLGFKDDDVNYFWKPEETGTEHCFPQCGTVPNDVYSYKGKDFPLGMHGFAQNREFSVAEKSESHIIYAFSDDAETINQFPWRFSFQIIYALEKNTLKTTYRIENRDISEMFFSVGGHPRYACPIGGGTHVEDYAIVFEKPESIETVVKAYSPIEEIEKRLSKDGKTLQLDYAMFSKGCFCFSPYHSAEITLKNDKNGRGMLFHLGGSDHLQFWTQPNEPFLAIEPLFGAISSLPMKAEDGDWANKPGILRLKPESRHECSYKVTLLR